MKFKAAFIDIDGTLLNSRFVISPETRRCLLAFQQAGGRLVLSSARPYVGMQRYGEELCLAKYGGCYSALNGGEIVDAATLETIYAKTFSSGDIKTVFDTIRRLEHEARERGLEPLRTLYAGSGLTEETAAAIHSAIDRSSLNIMTYRGSELLAMRQEVYAAAEMFANQMSISIPGDFLSAVDFLPAKLLVSGAPSLIQDVFPAMRAALGGGYHVVTSDPFLIEITPAGVDKGSSMEWLAGRWGIPLEAVAAFGDSRNDLPMLQRAGAGVAMGNASDEVKQSAEFVTSSHDEDGIARFLAPYLD